MLRLLKLVWFKLVEGCFFGCDFGGWKVFELLKFICQVLDVLDWFDVEVLVEWWCVVLILEWFDLFKFEDWVFLFVYCEIWFVYVVVVQWVCVEGFIIILLKFGVVYWNLVVMVVEMVCMYLLCLVFEFGLILVVEQ